jgi:hypothetical protein
MDACQPVTFLCDSSHESARATPSSPGRISTLVHLSLRSATAGCTLYFTLDGSAPGEDSPVFREGGGFALPAGEVTVRAHAKQDGWVGEAGRAGRAGRVETSTTRGCQGVLLDP